MVVYRYLQNKSNTKEQKAVSWAPNQHIRMISEGSCDTEDWSNNTENEIIREIVGLDAV